MREWYSPADWFAAADHPTRLEFVVTDFLYVPQFLTPDDQRRVVQTVMNVRPGFYVPKTRFNTPLRLRMLCMGRHWSARDYRYHATRVDADGLPCPPIPDLLQRLACAALIDSGYMPADQVRPFGVVIANWYDEGVGRLGDHVDNSEPADALASGYPVVSLSVGASCVFRFGGLTKTDPFQKVTLASGDLVIFGRSLRLAYHGVSKVMAGTRPGDLGIAGRLNLTFRLI